MMKNRKASACLLLILGLFIFTCTSCLQKTDTVPESNVTVEENAVSAYADSSLWAYWRDGSPDVKEADCFLVCPTACSGRDGAYNMSLDWEDAKESFVAALNMERGIYDGSCRMYAPYYRQATLEVYSLPSGEWESYLQTAYEDVADAFEYYMEHENRGRPLVLAGFSQGADLCIRLMKDYFDKEEYQERLIGCYAIGWSITGEEMGEYPFLRFAESEKDTGKIISFNSEAEEVADSIIIPKGTKTLSINPLNWRTDSQKADASLNKGACFMKGDGSMESEIPALTGAHIDSTRGALKVTDVKQEDYPAALSFLESGVYHIYDYQFFYRNLQENVKARTDEWMRLRQGQ